MSKTKLKEKSRVKEINKTANIKMKINLILLPFEETVKNPPISLAYIGAILKREGHEVKLIDLNFEKEIPNSDINIVATTTLDYYNCPLLNLGSIKKNLMKIRELKKPIILIGPHGTSTPNYFENYADYIVIGEPEITVKELVSSLSKRRSVRKVKGLHYKEGRKFITTPPRPLISDLDSLPFPDRSLIKNEKYYNPICKNNPFTAILTSRGCPYQCTFCYKGVYGSKWRKRSAENVVKELIEIREKYGIKEVWFRDDLFLLDKERVIKICEGIIKNKLDISWSCASRVDNLDFSTLKKMKEAGCYVLSFGIESGSEEILRRIKKGITLEKVKEVVRWCKKLDIRTRGYFIIGFPGETAETINKTLKFAKELDLDYFMLSIMTPYPNTEIYNEAMREKIIPGINWEYSLKYAGRIKTKFQFSELVKIKRKLYLKYYLRPFYIFPRLNRKKVDILLHGLYPFLKQMTISKFRGLVLEKN